MIKLKDLKKGDKFYIMDVHFNVCNYEDIIVKCIVIKNYMKTKGYILVKTLDGIDPESKQKINFENNEIINKKLYENVEEYIYDINDLDEAIQAFKKYEYYYNLGLGSKLYDMFDDPYELGKIIEDSNNEACKNFDCINCRCYNDDCDYWKDNFEEYGSKSDYDEEQDFINNLDPNDPADEWFFED